MDILPQTISGRDKIYLSLVNNTILSEQEYQQIEKVTQPPVKKL